jgi:hypothetical protein
MNLYFYSPSKNAFYPLSLQPEYESAGTWPDDGIEVPNDIAKEFMAEPPVGKIRSAGGDGFPMWIDKPEPTHEELVAAADAEKQERINQANEYMNSRQWPGKAALGRLKGDELKRYGLWLDYLDALESVDTSSASNIDWPIPPVQ